MFRNQKIRKSAPPVNCTLADSTTPYNTILITKNEDVLSQGNQQDQQQYSSSELRMFTLITPNGKSRESHRMQKNDTNNNSNDRNNNTGGVKSKLDKLNDEDGNNNGNGKRQLLQRYPIENGPDPTAIHHSHHLLLLQQQQQQINSQQMAHMDGKSSNLIPVPENSPSLIVLQPSAQSTGYSSFFNHYATGK